jgi:Cdc6-like AAA superfamily ATPase
VRIDPGLEMAVQDFVATLTPVLERVVASLPDTPERRRMQHDVRRDVTVEAYNLACAFIDADGLATDDELWALIAAFAPVLDTQLERATPSDVRKAGLTTGKARWLEQPSDLFEILLGVDRRDGTRFARAYYEQAVRMAHTIASLDLHHSRTELLAIEGYRGRLLDAMEAAYAPAPPAEAAPGRRGDPTTAQATGTTGTAPAGTTGEAGPPADPPPRPLDELLADLDALVGMDEVKEEVKLVANLIQVQSLRRRRELPVLESSRHLVFTGNPGTGKTTVARLLAQIYRTLGVVERGHLVETDRSALVAGYVGQTAPKVVAVFDAADEGVLLIDEAYALARGGEHDFGREAIDTIVKLVEDRRDRVVVIAAGYPDEMDDFVGANPGLRSRFPKTIFFPDYTTDQLVKIFASLCEKAHYRPDPSALDAVRVWLDAQPRVKGFGNGRLARNLFEHAVTRQATRIVGHRPPDDGAPPATRDATDELTDELTDDLTDDQLVTLTDADIPPIGEGPGSDQETGAQTGDRV